MTQLLNIVGKGVGPAGVAPEGTHGRHVATRGAAEAKVDAAGVK